jgi:putative phage-type endonuclease
MLTASDVGTALGVNKYQSSKDLLKKKCETSVFKENPAVYHGKKYELIAQLFYMEINNVIVEEFGLIRSEDHSFLGASPDGICSKYTLDKINSIFSKLVGRMLEIKCPVTRKIIPISNKIYDSICPAAYWVQIQIQLQVCKLKECDFEQCEIIEYKTRQEYLNDTTPTVVYCDNKGTQMNIGLNISKGMIIELVEKDTDNLKIWDRKPKHFYPKRLNISLEEYNEWVVECLNNIPKNYVFYRIIYWKMKLYSCVLIYRDDLWFSKNLPKITDFWNSVLYYRQNKEEYNNKYNNDLDGLAF